VNVVYYFLGQRGQIPGNFYYPFNISKYIKCTLDYAKRSFCSAVGGILGKLLNIASEDVIVNWQQMHAYTIIRA